MSIHAGSSWIRATIALLFWAGMGGAFAFGHFPILTLETNEGKKGQTVTAILRYGHPFENEFENCEQPEKVGVITPEGKDLSVTPQKSQWEVGGKTYQQWKVEFVPEMRGDYLIRAEWKPKSSGAEEGTAIREIAETWVHVQQEKGWDQPKEGWNALTRPYGILPGMVFRARLGLGGKGDAKTPVGETPFEFEFLNPGVPVQMPKSTLVTFTGKTDHQGQMMVSFPKAGWWAISAELPGSGANGDKKNKTINRQVLWVLVDRAE